MVHTYKLGGFNIAIDAGSCAVHAVDDLVFDLLQLYEGRTPEQLAAAMLEKYPELTREEILDAVREIDGLKEKGKLFSPDRFASLPPKSGGEIKALCLHVSHACNLSCRYCFASEGCYRGERALMPAEVAKRAIDFLIERSGRRRNLEVDFFGGEPLLNWGVVKETVAYARSVERQHSKNFRFTLTTNGVLINDDVIDFTNREMSNVVLSLDGRRETNDRLRKTPGGEGSYGLILPKFQELVERRGGKNYYVRGTYTHYNTDFTNDILHLADLGFTELSMEPVVSGKNEPYALTEEDLPVLLEQYEKLAAEMLRRRREGGALSFYHFNVDLTGGPCIYKRTSGCGVGTEYLAVTPTGDLYPCHQFVGEESFRMGTLWDGVTNLERRDAFSRCGASRIGCRDCWARLYCAGGCTANAYHATGDIGGVYDYGCTLFKKRLECAIMMKVTETLENNATE